MSSAFLDAVRARRTVYALEAKSPIADSKIIEVVNETVKHVPSSYNSQSARAVVLFKAEHEKLWDITIEVLKAIVPEDAFPATLGKLNAFKAGYGTVLFFEGMELKIDPVEPLLIRCRPGLRPCHAGGLPSIR